MANLTRSAIKASLLKLLNDRPLSQITVKDIVSACGINRNTFYYHYQGIPELIEEIVDDEAEAIIQSHPTLETLDDCLNAIVRAALDKRRAILQSITPPAGTCTSNICGTCAAMWSASI